MNSETQLFSDERTPSGVPGMDDVLHGGLVPRQLYLIEGNPGSGKTTFSLQFLIEGVRRGEKCLYITLSESERELRFGAQTHGWDLEGVDIIELVANDEILEREAQVTMYNPSEVELSGLTQRVLQAVEELHPTRVVFDSLSELKLLSQSSLRYRRQVLALKHFLLGRGCTVFMLDDKTSEEEDLQLQSIAQGVICLTQFFPTYGASRRKLSVIKMRGAHYSGGLHDFNIETGGLRVFPRLIAGQPDQLFEAEVLKSGVPAFDDLLAGGIDRGSSTLFIGPAGSGKSTLALAYANAAAQKGKHASVFLFDESTVSLKTRAKSLGLNFEEGSGPGTVRLRTVDPAEVSPGEFANMVRTAVEKDFAEVIVIDSLNGYLNAMSDEPFLSAQLHELLSFLGRRGVSTFLVVAQHGIVGSVTQSPIDTSYLADNVILNRYYEHRGHVKKAVSVVKKRSGPHEETIRGLTFDNGGIQVTEPLSQLRGVLTGVPVEVEEAAPKDKLQ